MLKSVVVATQLAVTSSSIDLAEYLAVASLCPLYPRMNTVKRLSDQLRMPDLKMKPGLLANNGGNALTDQTTTIETYRRVDDPETGPMFEMSMVISDPGHLTETWTVSWQKRFAPEGLDFVETDCKLPLPPSS